MNDTPPTFPAAFPPGEWRAYVLVEPTDFMRMQMRIMLGLSTTDGMRVAAPAPVALAEPVEPYVSTEPAPVPFLTLPVEAAEVLFETLAAHFLGTSDVVRLSQDLAAERRRVDALIAGIGRLGASSSTRFPRDVSGG